LALFILKELNIVKNILKYSKWLILMILIVNPLISGAGKSIVFSTNIFKFNLIITFESIIYGIVMGTKMILIITVIKLVTQINEKEDIYTFFHRYFRQLTLTLSMSSNAVDSLKEEYERVKMVMFIRGMSIENANFFQRIIRSGYLIKVVFTGVLEGVFDRSEALYSRNFTKNPSTDFKPLVWKKKDTVFLILILIVLIGVFSGLLLGTYDFDYYPTFSGKFNKTPLVFLSFTIFSGLYGIKEKKSDDKL